jgi:hypothetical protein
LGKILLRHSGFSETANAGPGLHGQNSSWQTQLLLGKDGIIQVNGWVRRKFGGKNLGSHRLFRLNGGFGGDRTQRSDARRLFGRRGASSHKKRASKDNDQIGDEARATSEHAPYFASNR